MGKFVIVCKRHITTIYVQFFLQLTKISFQTQKNKTCNLYQNEIKTTIVNIGKKFFFFRWAANSAQDGTTTDVSI